VEHKIEDKLKAEKAEHDKKEKSPSPKPHLDD